MPDLSNFKPTTFSVNKSYSLQIYKGIYQTKITMKCSNVVNTSQIPTTYETLNRHLPTVFRTKCFNEENNPFSVEVKKTEIAHLFEHIMLEYICQYKVARGEKNVSVSGVTNWNWKKEPFGTFHITLRVGKDANSVFAPALEKSCELLNLLVNDSLMKKQMASL